MSTRATSITNISCFHHKPCTYFLGLWLFANTFPHWLEYWNWWFSVWHTGKLPTPTVSWPRFFLQYPLLNHPILQLSIHKYYKWVPSLDRQNSNHTEIHALEKMAFNKNVLCFGSLGSHDLDLRIISLTMYIQSLKVDFQPFWQFSFVA